MGGYAAAFTGPLAPLPLLGRPSQQMRSSPLFPAVDHVFASHSSPHHGAFYVAAASDTLHDCRPAVRASEHDDSSAIIASAICHNDSRDDAHKMRNRSRTPERGRHADQVIATPGTASSQACARPTNAALFHTSVDQVISTGIRDTPGWVPGAPPKGEQPGPAPENNFRDTHDPSRFSVVITHNTNHLSRCLSPGWLPGAPPKGEQPGDHDQPLAPVNTEQSQPPLVLGILGEDPRAVGTTNLQRVCTISGRVHASSAYAQSNASISSRHIHANEHAENICTGVDANSHNFMQDQIDPATELVQTVNPGSPSHCSPPSYQQSYPHSSFSTFAQRPAFACGYGEEQAGCTSLQPDLPNHATAVKRMRADTAALAKHGGALDITTDPIRAAHAYQCHLEQFYSELHGISKVRAAPSLGTTASSATPACTSVHINTASQSGAQGGILPACEIKRFCGVDPNGSDALVGRPAKLSKLS